MSSAFEKAEQSIQEAFMLRKVHIDNIIRNTIMTLSNRCARGLNEHAELLTKVSYLVSPYVFDYRGYGDVRINMKSRSLPCHSTPEQMLYDLNMRLDMVLVHYKLPYTLTFIPNRNSFGIVYGLKYTEVGVMDRADELVQVMAI